MLLLATTEWYSNGNYDEWYSVSQQFSIIISAYKSREFTRLVDTMLVFQVNVLSHYQFLFHSGLLVKLI